LPSGIKRHTQRYKKVRAGAVESKMGVLECEKRSANTGFLIVAGTLKKGQIQTIKPARCGLYFNSGSGGWIRTNDGYETEDYNPLFLCQILINCLKLMYELSFHEV
jgi:hypothetical protein